MRARSIEEAKAIVARNQAKAFRATHNRKGVPHLNIIADEIVWGSYNLELCGVELYCGSEENVKIAASSIETALIKGTLKLDRKGIKNYINRRGRHQPPGKAPTP